jgi:two-component system cell cycle sensor histidine kinase PleC
MIQVIDTGVGMSEQDLAIALTPFGQVDATHARWREGTGLGLPIAKALVQLHGGELRIKSQKDVGTEVTVLLPLRQKQQQPAEPLETVIARSVSL